MTPLPLNNKLVSDISQFLATSRHLAKLNFCLKLSRNYKVYPTAYSLDVKQRVAGGGIGVVIDPRLGVPIRTPGHPKQGKIIEAAYDHKHNLLHVNSRFRIASSDHQQGLIHECTHAHFDIQHMGAHPCVEDEAAAYIAGALFMQQWLAQQGQLKWGRDVIKKRGTEIEKAAHLIAEKIMGGTYWVASTELTVLLAKVKQVYGNKKPYSSDGVPLTRR